MKLTVELLDIVNTNNFSTAFYWVIDLLMPGDVLISHTENCSSYICFEYMILFHKTFLYQKIDVLFVEKLLHNIKY